MGYPQMRTALPTNFIKPTTTSKVLTPSIVFLTVVVLASSSVVVVAIAGSIFGSRRSHPSGVKIAQALLVIAGSLTTIYIAFHIVAAVRNEAVGVIRPPILTIHATCFILARLTLLGWLVSMIASAAAVSKSSTCQGGNRDCNLQIVGIVGSTIALIATGVLLTALESCQYPFQIPEALNWRLITCRISEFGDDIAALDRSVSQTSVFYQDENMAKKKGQNPRKENSVIKRKALPEKRIHIPGEWPSEGSGISESTEGPITSRVPRVLRSTSGGWGKEWAYTEQDKEVRKQKVLQHSDSGISMARSDGSSEHARSSSGCVRSSSGYGSLSDHETPSLIIQKRQSRPQLVTQDYGISNFPRRSHTPAVMRMSSFSSDRIILRQSPMDVPKLAVRPELRYSSMGIPSYHDRRFSRTAASVPQSFPLADIYAIQRRPFYTPHHSGHRETGKPLPPVHRPSTMKGKSSKVTARGPYFDQHNEDILDEHMRKIEVEGILRRERDSRDNLKAQQK